jgi:hypothetical protein
MDYVGTSRHKLFDTGSENNGHDRNRLRVCQIVLLDGLELAWHLYSPYNLQACRQSLCQFPMILERVLDKTLLSQTRVIHIDDRKCKMVI